MHSLLERQIKRYLGEYAVLPPALTEFLGRVDDAYNSADADRLLIERSLELMSRELTERNADLRNELEERQRAEAQLENLLSLLGTTLESTADGILVLDREGQVMRFNQSFVGMWQVPDDIIAFWSNETLIQHLQEQVKDRTEFMEKLNNLRQQPEKEFYASIGCMDSRVIECYSLPQSPGDDKVGRVLSFRDITERKLAEELLQQEKAEQKALIKKLEEAHSFMLQSEKMASIGQLAAGVAHEINNPIGFVYSNLGTLEKYVQDVFSMIDAYEQAEGIIADGEVRARLQSARKKLDLDFLKEDLRALMEESKDGITRVKNIVQNLKDFSHVDTADAWRFSNLHDGINSTLNIVNNEIKYKADVIKQYGDIPEVECLSSQLNQVFMNLLVNASHAIEERGTITVRSGQQGEEVWVEVADTGKGIPPEHMQKIFDPFFTTKPVGQGTGLGLSLSYGIIQKHHGRLEVASVVGKGTTFRVWLPLRQPPRE
jgi:signal transduction histidine kinase